MIKLVVSFPVLPPSRREREKERGNGGCLLYFYCITCIALMCFFSFNVACVYCLFLIVPWDGL